MRFVYLIIVWTTEDESDDTIRFTLWFKKKRRCEAILRNNSLNMYLTSFKFHIYIYIYICGRFHKPLHPLVDGHQGIVEKDVLQLGKIQNRWQ